MRGRHIIPVTAFFALLSLPAIETVFRPIAIAPTDENRKLAPRPKLTLSDPHAMLAASKKWIEDHFGFRSFLIRLKTQIDYSVFNTSNRVHIGKDGFLFYRSVLDDERFVIDRLLQQRMNDVLTGVVHLRDDLARRSKRLVILISPTKEVLYPEMLPAGVPKFPKLPQIDRLRAGLNQIPGITFIDPVGQLRALKQSHPVFFKTDAHWTWAAAFDVGNRLVTEIARQEGWPSSPWSNPLLLYAERYSGGEARDLPLFRRPSETIEKLLNIQKPLPVSKAVNNVGPFDYLHEALPEVPGLLPCVTVVGDSFWMSIQVAGVGNYFKGFYQATWYRFADFKALLDTPDCKYFIVQFVQGNRLAIETLANYR